MDDIRGIELTGDMTKEQLVAEIQAHNREMLMGTPLAELKALVIDSRMNKYRSRLEKEAKVEVHRSMFGTHVREQEQD